MTMPTLDSPVGLPNPNPNPNLQHHVRDHSPDEYWSGPESDNQDGSRAAKRKRPLTVSYVSTFCRYLLVSESY